MSAVWLTSCLANIRCEPEDVRAVVPLISTLKDKRAEVRRPAAWALGQLGDVRAVQPLMVALKDKNADVSNVVRSALINITQREP